MFVAETFASLQGEGMLAGVPSFFIRKEIYLMAFLPYIVLSTGVFYAALKGRHYRPRDLFLGRLHTVKGWDWAVRGARLAGRSLVVAGGWRPSIRPGCRTTREYRLDGNGQAEGPPGPIQRL